MRPGRCRWAVPSAGQGTTDRIYAGTPRRCSPYLFRSYAHPTARPTAGPGPAGEPAAGSGKARLWQGLRSSSAAPYFLEEYQLGEDRFSDGGMAANNPTALALREARHLWPDR